MTASGPDVFVGDGELSRLPDVGRPERDGSRLVHDLAGDLRRHIDQRPPWLAGVRWLAAVQHVRGTNTVVGHPAPTTEVVGAAVDGRPVAGDPATARVVTTYARALRLVDTLAADVDAVVDEVAVRRLHRTITADEDGARPGRWRTGPVGVFRGPDLVYRPPPADAVPHLMGAVLAGVPGAGSTWPYVDAAVALFNLMRIHPFDDGNGRVGRAFHTLVVARATGLPRELVSVEEQLAVDHATYQGVMYHRPGPDWSPAADPRLWVRFALAAHVAQGQRNLRRCQEAERLWGRLADALPEAGVEARARVFEAAVGRRIPVAPAVPGSPPGPRDAAGLSSLVDAGWLQRSHGIGGGWAEAGPRLAALAGDWSR